MARWARSGRHVELLTVFALDPGSTRRREAGIGAPDSSPRAMPLAHVERRIESRARSSASRRAGSRSGASTSTGTATTERCGTPCGERRRRSGRRARARARRSPIRTMRGCTRLVFERLPRRRRAATRSSRTRSRRAGAPFVRVDVSSRDRLAKWRAIRAYRSQLPLLAMRRSLRSGPLRLAWADERVELPEGRVDLPL